MPNEAVLVMLEQFCFNEMQGRLFLKKIDLERIYTRYFYNTFVTQLTPLTFYPQSRAGKKQYADFILSRDDIKKLASDFKSKVWHKALLELVKQIDELLAQVRRNGLVLRLIEESSVLYVESLEVQRIFDEINQDAWLCDNHQKRFVEIFKEFEETLRVKAEKVVVKKKAQAQKEKIIQFVEQLENLLRLPCFDYPSTVDGVSKFIRDMILNYQALFNLGSDELVLYDELCKVARDELLSSRYPSGFGHDCRPLNLHAAICFASVTELEVIREAEIEIEEFVGIFLMFARWRFTPATKELSVLDSVLVCYREFLEEPKPAHVLYRQAVIIAQKEWNSIKSLSMQPNDVRRLHEGILWCDKSKLQGLSDFDKSARDFVFHLEVFLKQQSLRFSDVLDGVERAIKSALTKYEAVMYKSQSVKDTFSELTAIAANELRVINAVRAKPNVFFGMPAVNDLVLLHIAIFDRDTGALMKLADNWCNEKAEVILPHLIA